MSQRRPTAAEIDRYSSAFVLGSSQGASFFEAFLKSKASKKTAREYASKFHNLPAVQQRIAQYENMARKLSEKKFGTDATELKKVLSEVIHMGLKLKTDGHGNKIPVDLKAPVSAVSEINKMDGNYKPEKHEFITPVPVSITRTVVDP